MTAKPIYTIPKILIQLQAKALNYIEIAVNEPVLDRILQGLDAISNRIQQIVNNYMSKSDLTLTIQRCANL